MHIFSPDHENALATMPHTLRLSVIGSLFLYVFRGTDQANIREVFNAKSVAFDFLSWRRQLHSNGDLLRNGKIFLYHHACGLSPNSSTFGLTRRENIWLRQALEFEPLVKRLNFLFRSEHRPPMSLSSFDDFSRDVLTSQDYKTYVRRYIHKKMSFLVASYNVTFKELESDLISWSHFALLRAYPRFDDVGHGIAIAKTIAKRRGVNLIKTLTAQKNNQLITKADGSCERVAVSLSNIADGSGQFLTADGTFLHRSMLVVGMNGLSSAADSVGWDTLLSIKELISSKSLTPAQRYFLALMVGTPDQDFSDFLGSENEEYIHRVDYSVYKNKVCDFLELSEPLADRFLSNLKPHLGGSSHSTQPTLN